MNLKALPSPVETFKIELASAGDNTSGNGAPATGTSTNKGTLSVLWESTDAWVPITVLH
jgi:hypothetical protein